MASKAEVVCTLPERQRVPQAIKQGRYMRRLAFGKSFRSTEDIGDLKLRRRLVPSGEF